MISPEIQNLINEHISLIEEKTTELKRQKMFHSPLSPAYFNSSVLELRTILNFNLRKAIRIWLSKKKSNLKIFSNGPIIISPSLNSVLVFNLIKQKVLKIVNKELEPNFLNNELIANRLVPQYTPKIISSGQRQYYYYIITQYYDKKKSITWKQWPAMLQKLLPFFTQLYKNHKITIHSSDDYVNNIKQQLNNCAKNKKYLLNKFGEVNKLLQKCLNRYQVSGAQIYTTFTHGDLLPNNIIITSDSFYICDWTNGGEHNIMYDLMIQNVYAPQSKSWQQFDSINFINCDDKEIFFGWTRNFLENTQQSYQIILNNDIIRLSLILSLAEIAIKNFLRHQSKEECQEGISMLLNVEKICHNILR